MGLHALTNVELITLALGLPDTATAEEMLAQADGSLRRLATRINEIDVKGVGEVRSVTLAATFEIGLRALAELRPEHPALRSPRDVAAVMAPRLEDLMVEEMHVLILDAQHRLSRDVLVTRGILNSSLVHPREVFKTAIVENAAAIICVHNHPSGDWTPSADDRNVTDQLVAAGRLLGIPVHDHIIIGRGGYASFAEMGLL